MPLSALPSCYKPQVINVSQNTGTSADSLSSIPSSPSNLSAASSLDSLSGSFSELSVVNTNGAEGASSLEKKEGEPGIFYWVSFKLLNKRQHSYALRLTSNDDLTKTRFLHHRFIFGIILMQNHRIGRYC